MGAMQLHLPLPESACDLCSRQPTAAFGNYCDPRDSQLTVKFGHRETPSLEALLCKPGEKSARLTSSAWQTQRPPSNFFSGVLSEDQGINQHPFSTTPSH